MKIFRASILALAAIAAGSVSASLGPDQSFGSDGIALATARGPTDEGIVAKVVDDQGRIVAAVLGVSNRGVARFLADGSLDLAFADEGFRALDFLPRDVALQSDGRIVVVGGDTGPLLEQDWQIARLLNDGSPDLSFGSQGRLTLDWFGSGDEAISVVASDDGRIVVGGRAFDPNLGTAFATAVFTPSGALDWQRADKLFSGTSDICNQVLIEPDNQIVCVGLSRNFGGAVMVAVRFNSNGSLDEDFGVGGIATVAFDNDPTEAETAWLSDSGHIVLAGFVDRGGQTGRALALARLTASGALDTEFGEGGLVKLDLAGESSESISGLYLGHGRIYAAVQLQSAGDFMIVAFHENGALDTSFGSDGKAVADFNGGVDLSLTIVGHQNRLLVGGFVASSQASAQRDLGLARFDPQGVLDPGFGLAGRVQSGLTGLVNVTIVDGLRRQDGGVVVAGYIGSTFSGRDILVAAFRSDGGLDPNFGDQGQVVLDFDNGLDESAAIVELDDGRLLVAGTVRPEGGSDDFAVLRLLPDGSLDSSFGQDGWAVIDIEGGTDTGRALVVQPDGKLVMLGEARFPTQGNARNFTLVRLRADGSLDPEFGSGGVANLNVATFDSPISLALQSDGAIVIGGSANSDFVIARFLANGSLDTDFANAGVASIDFNGQFDFAQHLIMIPDWMEQGERILMVGTARSSSAVSSEDMAAVMLNLDGNPETGFGTNGLVVHPLAVGMPDQAQSVAIFGDRLVLAGRVNQAAMGANLALLALDMSGQIDPGFFITGESLVLDLFGSDDELVALDSDELTIMSIGQTFDPQDSGGLRKIVLLRLAVSEIIFSDRFQIP